MNDGFVATVSPLASGEWLVTLCKEYPDGDIAFDSDNVERIFGVGTRQVVSTEKRAIKRAYKMLAAVRRAEENRNRKSFEIR